MSWTKHLSLRLKIVSIVGLACLLCAAVSITGFIYFQKKELENGIINKQRTIHTQLAAATDFVAKQGGLDGVINKFTAKYTSADQMTKSEKLEVLNQVPIYASLLIGKKNAEVDHYDFRVFSNEPRREENRAVGGELEILKKFESNPELNEYIVNDGQVITTYRPVRLSEEQGCLKCHGNPNTSPWKNGTDVLGFKMENWADKKLHGVFAISQNMEAVTKASAGEDIITPAGWLIGAIVMGALVALAFASFIMSAPINALTKVATAISGVSHQVTAYSQKVASSSQDLAQAATEQAASLEETAASLEEISTMIAKASESATETAASSSESQQKADEGRAAVDEMTNSMTEISQSNDAIMSQINHSNQEMAEIVTVIQEIGTKTKVINEIVFQTKLLSFNASVEAARAGEHGKGFAVVAEEVGNLARMSGNAAKEITEMLDMSMSKVERIVQSTKSQVEVLVQQGRQKVESGTTVAQQCSDVLHGIVGNVARVAELAKEISQANQEQTLGVREINKAISQLDTVTQQNASASEEAAATARSLSSQADLLETSINELTEIVRGASSQTHRETKRVAEALSKPEKSKLAQVISLKPSKKSTTSPSPEQQTKMKAAVGAPMIPHNQDEGFSET